MSHKHYSKVSGRSSKKLRAAIRQKYGSIHAWAKDLQISRSAAYRILGRAHKFVHAQSQTGVILRRIHKDFGITPSDLGIQVLEVER